MLKKAKDFFQKKKTTFLINFFFHQILKILLSKYIVKFSLTEFISLNIFVIKRFKKIIERLMLTGVFNFLWVKEME